MKNKQNKSERGITLIALIVTIIILIILVAISIKTIAGDNLIDIAEGAATNYKSAEQEELNMLQNISDRLNSFSTKKDATKPRVTINSVTDETKTGFTVKVTCRR